MKELDKYFIPYDRALKIKQLGFDKKCFSYTSNNKNLYYETPDDIEKRMKNFFNKSIKIPLYQQAFDFFRTEHGYFTSPTERDNDKTKQYDWLITKNLGEGKTFIHLVGYHNYYEEAQLACLDKLIEITSNNN